MQIQLDENVSDSVVCKPAKKSTCPARKGIAKQKISNSKNILAKITHIESEQKLLRLTVCTYQLRRV